MDRVYLNGRVVHLGFQERAEQSHEIGTLIPAIMRQVYAGQHNFLKALCVSFTYLSNDCFKRQTSASTRA